MSFAFLHTSSSFSDFFLHSCYRHAKMHGKQVVEDNDFVSLPEDQSNKVAQEGRPSRATGGRDETWSWKYLMSPSHVLLWILHQEVWPSLAKDFPKILKVAPPERDHQWQFQGALHPEYEAHHDLKHQKLLHPNLQILQLHSQRRKDPSTRHLQKGCNEWCNGHNLI